LEPIKVELLMGHHFKESFLDLISNISLGLKLLTGQMH
jgi:hypothetical protein